MAESLNPPLFSRVLAVLRPDWTRTLPARRIAAGGLVVLAGVAALRPDPAGQQVEVVVAGHDVGPGTLLSTGDVTLQHRPAATIPDGAARDPAAMVGATLAGPVRRGEVLTDVRLLGPRLTEAAAGPDARLVPVHPADVALIDVLRPGDIVDVVTAGQADSTPGPATGPRVVAAGGIVVTVSGPRHSTSDERVVLVALPAAAATAVAGTALAQPVTLTMR